MNEQLLSILYAVLDKHGLGAFDIKFGDGTIIISRPIPFNVAEIKKMTFDGILAHFEGLLSPILRDLKSYFAAPADPGKDSRIKALEETVDHLLNDIKDIEKYKIYFDMSYKLTHGLMEYTPPASSHEELN